jgi:hypothetical protein
MSEVIELNGENQVETQVIANTPSDLENQLTTGDLENKVQAPAGNDANKRREGQIRAEEKRKREQEEREARLVASAVETALSKVMPQFTQQRQEAPPAKPELPDVFAGISPEALEQYSELRPILEQVANNAANRGRMQATQEFETRFGQIDQRYGDKFSEISGVLPQLQQGMVNSMAGVDSSILSDPAFQDYLEGETDAGVSRRDAMAFWQKSDPQKAAVMLGKFSANFQRETKPITGFDHMAAPAQSNATVQSSQPAKRFSLAKIQSMREAELNKQNPSSQVLQQLREVETRARQTNTLDS